VDRMTQDHYRYDRQGYDVHLGGDRVANAARALDGYPLDVQPDSTWPGLEGSGDILVQPDAVRGLSDLLKRHADAAASLPGWLTMATSVSFGPPTWYEANNLKTASELVRGAVETYIKDVLANMAATAQALDEAAGHYGRAEQANTHAAQSTNAAMGEYGGGGVTGGTQIM
jgi:hypothetical protein